MRKYSFLKNKLTIICNVSFVTASHANLGFLLVRKNFHCKTTVVNTFFEEPFLELVYLRAKIVFFFSGTRC